MCPAVNVQVLPLPDVGVGRVAEDEGLAGVGAPRAAALIGGRARSVDALAARADVVARMGVPQSGGAQSETEEASVSAGDNTHNIKQH
jgi:hypothetical protein